MKTQSVPVAVKLTPETKERLKSVAEQQDRSIHWLMKEAVNQFLDREERKAALRTAADESWRHYQETGSHLTLEEVNKWMDDITDGKPVEPLKCRK
ncbi:MULTISPECIES: CopG family ribbon-helix-helix protein [Neisseria]|uniref:CopG family transcriptional regulator n=1 Tax=Neisseria wadsworthii 9715 TaxID=1030841 RepID=G4CN40_9NEIS|nr:MULTISPECIES: ribbon-helix-helix protein, CopG family [Neisseria]EGZ50650.1 CopG family transcriptional regulator [Neisseria wadsworthii 9715]KPN72649.1 toxin RelE [Neisseria sp. 83E34]QMT36494.1 ribbon-helix-helix protein, CopG family [Neisseria wadsworthii]